MLPFLKCSVKRMQRLRHTPVELVENLVYLYQHVTAVTYPCSACFKFEINSPGHVVCVL